MKKYILSIVFSILFHGISLGQKTLIDSLKIELGQKAVSDTAKVSLLQQLTRAYLPVSVDTTILLSRKSLAQSILSDNYKIAKSYSNMGIAHSFLSQIDSSEYYLEKALKALDGSGNEAERASVYSNYAVIYQNSGRFDKVIEYNNKAIELIRHLPEEVCTNYLNQAVIYANIGLYDNGQKYLKLAYKNAQIAKNDRIEGLTLGVMGGLYLKGKKLDSALFYLQKGQILCDRTRSPEICFRINSVLGEVFMEMDEDDQAAEVLLKAKSYAEERKLPHSMLTGYMLLGQLENKRGNYKKSSGYFEKYQKIRMLNNSDLSDIASFRIWSETEEKLGRYKKANKLLKTYVDMKDSMFSKENKQILADSEARFESEKKDREIAEQQLAIQKNEARSTLMYLLIASLLLAGALLWFLFRQRQMRLLQQLESVRREHKIDTLELLIEGEENERLRIARELHDGVSGDLSAIKFKLATLQNTKNEVINDTMKMIDTSCEQIRAISHNLIPPCLKNFNLQDAVAAYCQNMNAVHAPDIRFEYVGDSLDIEKKQETNIFRIVQELVTNSIKYAEANEIFVQLSKFGNTLQVTVEDDGKGFDMGHIPGDGIGLRNVRSRIDYLGAQFDAFSDAQGTSYVITLYYKLALA